MGQNYIVDSFLVVVTGGVGKLAGSVWAGLGLGTLDQLLEPRTFGEALLAAGLIGAGLLDQPHGPGLPRGKEWGWLTLLVPVPLPFAVRVLEARGDRQDCFCCIAWPWRHSSSGCTATNVSAAS